MPSDQPALRVLLAGKHELAKGIFDALRRDPRVVLGVVTSASESPDMGRPGLASALRDTGMPPLNVAYGHADLHQVVRRFRPDVFLSAGFDKIIRAVILEAVRWPLNVHFALLPRHRGSYSIPWAILEDDDLVGVTLHRMGTGIDDGPIVEQRAFPNDRAASARELYDSAVTLGVALATTAISRLAEGDDLPERAQDGSNATYHPPEYPRAFRVPWAEPVRYVANYLRASHFPPYASAHSLAGSIPVELEWPASVGASALGLPPGTLFVREDGPWIAARDGAISPEHVRVNGARMSFREAAARLGNVVLR